MLKRGLVVAGACVIAGMFINVSAVSTPPSAPPIPTTQLDKTNLIDILDMEKLERITTPRIKVRPKYKKHKWARFIATWYSYRGCDNTPAITATGARVRDNYTIAVDPRVIPLHSVVEVKFRDGRVQRYVADDVGGAIKGFHIDIFNSNEHQCVVNGVQHVMVRIVRRGR
jgi:3D (Asp-Asp-Asp) domain-containing protein